jgi:hypothetical protein
MSTNRKIFPICKSSTSLVRGAFYYMNAMLASGGYPWTKKVCQQKYMSHYRGILARRKGFRSPDPQFRSFVHAVSQAAGARAGSIGHDRSSTLLYCCKDQAKKGRRLSMGRGRRRVGKSFLNVCSIGRCSHVFGLSARHTRALGRSPGFAPRAIWLTKSAIRRARTALFGP